MIEKDEGLEDLLLSARKIAMRHESNCVGPLHIVAADLATPDSLIRAMLRLVASDAQADEAFGNQLQMLLGSAKKFGVTREPLTYCDELLHVMEGSENIDSGRLAWPQLLRRLLTARGTSISTLTYSFNLTPELLDRVETPERHLLHDSAMVKQDIDGSWLAKVGHDLTAAARSGLIEPVIGREVELHRLAVILGRKESNNAILVGDPGTGKTKIVEGLARMIARDEVPKSLRGRRIVQLDLSALVAGTNYRGEFEQRLNKVIDEVRAANGRVILFLDEIHQLLGLGQTNGSMDAAQILKPPLARGELRCIGATTYEEIRHIERDPALRRRFISIDVDEPAEEDVYRILEKVAPALERHHGVHFQPAALNRLARIARRYLPEPASPAREVGILDELGSARSLEEIPVPGPPAVPDISIQDVEQHVASAAGIPVQRVSEDLRHKLLNLEERLSAMVVGQDAVVARVSRALRRGLAGAPRFARRRFPRVDPGTFSVR